MRTHRLPAVDWTETPADLNGLVRFAERPNLVSARVPSRFEQALPKVYLSSSLPLSEGREETAWEYLQRQILPLPVVCPLLSPHVVIFFMNHHQSTLLEELKLHIVIPELITLIEIRDVSFCVATLRSPAHICGRFGGSWSIQNRSWNFAKSRIVLPQLKIIHVPCCQPAHNVHSDNWTVK